MYFPISGTHLDPITLVVLGFVVGVLGGFFGVGGSFLAGPALFALGVPFNFVVGTDLLHIVGKSLVAAREHHLLGHIDLKLAAFMVVGTIAGSETGVQAIEYLKRGAQVNWVVGIVSIVVFTLIGVFAGIEAWNAVKLHRKGALEGDREKDRLAFGFFARAMEGIQLPPHVQLQQSGIKSISIWSIVLVSAIGGLFSGFLGGGAGYIRMPCLVYLLGIPTHIAVGTDLFEIIISAGYGAVRHAMNGNVDVLIALVMQTGAAIGAQTGANLTQYFSGPRIRLAFAPLPIIGAILVAQKLLRGGP
ncbi:MAG TPA: sulfite exporter TauE/SafE family protein [Chthoniobacterales bacterium]|nr:sulfite exporter TauE/SafE family protein [Chthoniobacterales bacterium]